MAHAHAYYMPMPGWARSQKQKWHDDHRRRQRQVGGSGLHHRPYPKSRGLAKRWEEPATHAPPRLSWRRGRAPSHQRFSTLTFPVPGCSCTAAPPSSDADQTAAASLSRQRRNASAAAAKVPSATREMRSWLAGLAYLAPNCSCSS